MAPALSQEVDARTRLPGGLSLPSRLLAFRPPHLPSLFAAIVVATFALAILGGLTYLGARTFSRRAAHDRGAAEAISLATHSGRLATGDAFDGYLQILRDAEHPLVRAQATEPADRVEALTQLLYLNTNDFASLTALDRSGRVVATTDLSLRNAKASEAFATSRATLGPSNSDIVLPDDGPAYVDYAAPLKEADGTSWGILLGRAQPERLWTPTLLASVDGSRNIIVNNAGQYAAGVPEDLLRQPWRGELGGTGAVRADVAGVDSLCGLSPIARDTQIDHGWMVASCLPMSVVTGEQESALGQQALLTAAGLVAAVVVAAGLFRFGVRDRIPPLMLPAPRQDQPDEQRMLGEPAASPIPVISVDSRRLIEAYEARNARLSARLRETVQARLMIAATRADESYRLATADADLAEALHSEAMVELEQLQERELRGIGQELYPGLVRLGLPSALRALQREMADLIEVDLDIEATADSVGPGGERASIDADQRIVMYRLAFEGIRAIAAAGASRCVVGLHRSASELRITVTTHEARDAFDAASLDASAVAVEAFGGGLRIGGDGPRVAVGATFPA